MDSAVVAALAAAAAGTGGAGATWLATRRAASGRVGTSEAAVLWQQAQEMRAEERARADRAEAQRDRIIESQATQVLPALEAVDTGLRQVTAALARIAQAVARIEGRIGEDLAADVAEG